MPNSNLDLAGNVRSVLDPYHPQNHRDSHRDTDRDYVFRQRNANPLKLTLGWELEANKMPSRAPNGVEQISDGSVNGDGAEYIVLPAVTKSPRYVLGILKDLVHAPRLNTDESCGFHVHVSASNLTLPRMRQWALATEHLALQIEDLAFDAVPKSRKENQYCRRIRPLSSGARFVSSKYSNDRRYHWLNTVEMFRPNGIRTIENRLLGHTHRWKYVLSWALFTMELAKHGWDLANHPFEANSYVAHLEILLKQIATEIKPLDRKSEPVPQWVYDGLTKFGIDSAVWDRPLAKLTEMEYELKGYPKPFYSDDQMELPNHDEDEDNDDVDLCACGCGDEGRCDFQTHSDGDCDSNYCDRCHENGDCSGTPHCERCIERAHDNDEDCQRGACRTCHPTPRRLEVNTSGMVTGRINGNPFITPFNISSEASASLSGEIRAIHSMTIDNRNISLHGMGIAGMVIPYELERRALNVVDGHELALSLDREREVMERDGYMMLGNDEARQSQARMNNDGIGCQVGCTDIHTTNCLMCGQSWGLHSGHRCTPTGNVLGSFPNGGR